MGGGGDFVWGGGGGELEAVITKIGLEKEGGKSDNVERKAMVLRMVLVCVWEVWRGRNPVMKHSGIM